MMVVERKEGITDEGEKPQGDADFRSDSVFGALERVPTPLHCC